MKKLYSILIASILLVPSIYAQSHLFLEEQEINLKDGRSAAWVFPVVNDLEEALNDLKEYCKDRSDVKMKDEGDNIIMAEKVSIPTIATKRGDLIGYGFITQTYYGVALVFQMGYDISVNSKDWTLEMNNLHNYAKEFMSYHYEQSYSRKLEALEKELKDLQKELEQTESKIGSANKKITNLSAKIAKETDADKIEAMKIEVTDLESEIQVLSDALPPLNAQIEAIQGNIDTFKSESNTFQTTIGSL